MLLQVTQNLEEIIVQILAYKSNLTVPEITKELPRKFSIQGIYKELRKLQNEGVVIKNKQSFNLRLPWVLDILSMADTLSNQYFESYPLHSILPTQKKKKIWRFNNLLRMNDFWSHILLLLIQNSEKKILLGWNPHTWFHLVQTKQEEQYVKSLGFSKSKLYLIVGGNSSLDKWSQKFLDKEFVEYSFGKKNFGKNNNVYINIVDNYIVTVKIEQFSADRIERLYETIKSVDEINFNSILELFRNKTRCVIWLEYNPKKATIYRKKFIKHFGKI